MSNSSLNDCSPIDYYAQQKTAQLEKQIYYLQQTNALYAKYLQSTCITPVFSLIDYTTSFGQNPKNPVQGPYGNITYYQTVITNSFNGDRIWTFTLGGDLFYTAFYILYQFDPTCIVPNGYDFSTLSKLNFYKTGSTTEYEPLQGTLIVGNIGVNISLAPLVVALVWDAETGLLTFKINLNALETTPGTFIEYQRIKQLNFSPQTPVSFFLNLTIKDVCGVENSPC